MKNRMAHWLLPLLFLMVISACENGGDKGPGIVDINDVVDEVDTSGGSDGGGGGFGGTAINQCAAVFTISPGGVISGELNSSDCIFNDFITNSSRDDPTDGYVVTLASGGTITILMRSADFDARLFLYSCSDDCSNLTLFDDDDDGGGGVNGRDAEIIIDLAAGSYLILATRFGGDTSVGAYTLETTLSGSGSV